MSEKLYASEIEEAILGTCLTDMQGFLDIKERIDPECFGVAGNRKIYEHCMKFEEPDIVLVERSLGDQLDRIGRDYLLSLTLSATPRVEEYCQILIEKKIARQIHGAANSVLTSLNSEGDVYHLLDEFVRCGENLGVQTRHKHSLTPAEIFDREKNTPLQEKLLTGDQKLDIGLYRESGMKRGHVKMIIADSGHGKTSFALYEVECLLRRGYRVHWFQLEDYDVNTARHFEANVPEYLENICICHDLADIEEIKREARKIKRERGTDYIVIDYVQNVEAARKTRSDSVEYISQQITRMAKDLNVVVSALSQVTLDYKAKAGWSLEPSKGNVRWSQQLKQDAHAIVSVFRPSEITELIMDGKVKDWTGTLQPINSCWIRQQKVRYGEKDFRRYHMVHLENGLKPFTEEVPF